MTTGIGIITNQVIPPNGRPNIICEPQGQGLIITRLTFLTTWPEPEQAGYHPAQETESSYARSVNLYKGGFPWAGFNRQGAGHVKYNTEKTNGLPITLADPKEGDRFITVYERNGFASRGVYSIYSLAINQTPITGYLTAPPFYNALDLKGPITLGTGQTLTITNGHFPCNIHKTARDVSIYTDNTPGKLTYDTALTDHRTRASHLRVIAYGQEIQ